MKLKALCLISGLVLAAVWTVRAHAVGWDSDDFIITGAPNFSQYIGIFDHDFTFKGYLDNNFFGVRGMDFDAQGRLVAVSYLNPEIRVYNPDGTRAGGFTKASSPLLESGGDLKVAPDGNYVLGTNANGALVFTPQGSFVRRYADGTSQGITFVPDNRLWVGGAGTTVRIFDTDTGAQVGAFTADQQMNSGLLRYYASTNTVLMVDPDRDAGGVFERDLGGVLLRQFHVPIAQTYCNGATRGPGDHIFGTTSDFHADVVDWRRDATVERTIDVYPVQITPGVILWAGSVPEPACPALVILSSYLLASLRLERRQCMSGRGG